jgi:exodeoxyribonuclease-3
MNVAPLDKDIGIGEENKKRWLRTGKCCFLPEERSWLERLRGFGLIDTFEHYHSKQSDRYTWFDYRSRGFEMDPKRGLRIDLILASNSLIKLCTETGIDHELRSMEKPSDHCPIWICLDD